MSWYGKSTSRQLESLIQKKPNFQQLLVYPDFLIELQAFNTKLLEYLSTNTHLLNQAITYVTVPPSFSDCDDRKYKLPLLVTEMVETETTCILNAFMKETGEANQLYFDLLFSRLPSCEMMPLLMGYVYRIASVLIKTKHKEVIERVYRSPLLLNRLLEHTQHMAASNIIQLFLNLDVSKHQTTEEGLKIKQDIVLKIVEKIQLHSLSNKQTNCIENLCGILCETIQKYYLITDGKQLMEIIASRKTILLMMNLIRNPNNDFSTPAFAFCISLINYYSFSTFNVDDVTTESGKQALDKLESQPFISQFANYFASALDQIMRAPQLSLYTYQLLQVLCHCISISSFKILECVRQTNFFGCLINLLFKHQFNNILHKLVEKSFLHIFISDRKIYLQYKKYLFCQMDVIDCTAGRLLKMFPQPTNTFEEARRKPYFGHLMMVLKIYSGVKTVDEDIVDAIKAKSELWREITELVISKYQQICNSKLGTYEKVPEPVYQEFNVNRHPESAAHNEELRKQQTVQPSSSLTIHDNKQQLKDALSPIAQTSFIDISLGMDEHNNSYKQPGQPDRGESFMSESNVTDYGKDGIGLKKSESFQDFMIKSRQQAQKHLQLKRSLSQEKRLSAEKARITTLSPFKKNNWKEEDSINHSATYNQRNKNSAIYSEKKPVPWIPINRKGLTQSSVSQRNYTAVTPHGTNDDTKSLRSLQELKKIRVFCIDKPAESRYRQIEEKDRVLLQFLGLTALEGMSN